MLNRNTLSISCILRNSNAHEYKYMLRRNEICTDLNIYKYKFTDAYTFIGKNKNIQNSAYKYLYNKIMVHIMNMNYDDASNF